MNTVMIVSAIRTPIGIMDGNLRSFNEQKLAADTMLGAIAAANIPAGQLDEIIVGVAKQTSLPSNCARHAALLAKLPEQVPAYTVQRQSASGLQAIVNGFWSIGSGNAGMLMAGGSESMTLVPREIHNARYVFDEQTRIIFNPIDEQLAGAQPQEQYGTVTAQKTTEKLVEKYRLSKEELSDFAAASLDKALSRQEAEYILPLEVKKGKVITTVSKDELYASPREIASPADAAAMCVLGSQDCVKTMGLPILGQILSAGITAGDPAADGMVGVKAAADALTKAGLTLKDIDLIEINEMSAAQCLATCRELQKLGLGKNEIASKVNVCGGALAAGNPWGAAGAILFTDLIHRLREKNISKGLIIVSAEGGQTMAVIIQKA